MIDPEVEERQCPETSFLLYRVQEQPNKDPWIFIDPAMAASSYMRSIPGSG